MKKLLVLLIGCLVLSINIFSQQKKLVDHVGYIELQDSSATDTTYAPLYIQKEDIIAVETDKRNQSGGIVLHFWNNQQRTMVALDAASFNDFASNDVLRTWLLNAWNPQTVIYGFKTLENDSIRVYDTDEILKISSYVDGSSSDSVVFKGSTFTIDGVAMDSVILGPNVNLAIGDGETPIDSVTVNSRDGCKALLIFEKRE